MATEKPIRVFCSSLSGRIYACRLYSERPGGVFVSHSKDDVTSDAIAAVTLHVEQCEDASCICRGLNLR